MFCQKAQDFFISLQYILHLYTHHMFIYADNTNHKIEAYHIHI
jgi:hypothetical protein